MASPHTLPYDLVSSACEAAGVDPDLDLRTDYNGRAMMGDTCWGVVLTDGSRLGVFAAELMVAAIDEFGVSREDPGEDAELSTRPVREMLAAARLDQMGTGVIVYFPGWQLAD
jgi:hypothetical protein